MIILTTSYEFLSFYRICCTDDALWYLPYFLDFILLLYVLYWLYAVAPPCYTDEGRLSKRDVRQTLENRAMYRLTTSGCGHSSFLMTSKHWLS